MTEKKVRKVEEGRAERDAEARAEGPEAVREQAEKEEKYARIAARQGSPLPNETTGEPRSILVPESGTRLSAKEIHANVLGSAEEELGRSPLALLISAVAAGLTIGFSFLASAFLQSLVSEDVKPLAGALGYPIGFIFVVVARNELFTENTLEPVIPLLHNRDAETLGKLLRNWGVLILGNMIGGLVFAAILAYTNAVPEKLHAPMLALANESTSDGFGLTLWRAVFAGWLLALLTWMLAATHERIAQIVLVVLATAPIAAFQFRHSIAGSVEAFWRAMMGAATWGDMLGNFVVPALIGNALGGVVIVALLNFGQAVQDE